MRWTVRAGAVLGAAAMLALLFWCRGALYNRFVRFPARAAAWTAIRAARYPVRGDTGWHEYRGVLHSHSELSHDCKVPFEQILLALEKSERDFICLSDHCTNGRADFNAQWRGLHRGKLFIPGFEMKEGFMPFGVAPGTVLSNQTDSATLARQVAAHGGLLFYAHPEEPRVWERPELTGMEIYNIHADLKDEGGMLSLLPDLLLSQRRYPEQVLRSIFDRPEANLRRWDELNNSRHLTGIAGNDCHQNTGLRAFYTSDDAIRVEDTSPKKLAELKLNFLTRALAKWCFGPPIAGKLLFHIQLDPYDRMLRYVTTHVLAAELSEHAILEALQAGRAFIAFDLIADSSGFVWRGGNGSRRVVMGESLRWSSGTRLSAAAPHRCRFTVMRNGAQIYQTEGLDLDWPVPAPGVYRVEAELKVGQEWTPWIYANPIWIR